MVPYRYVLASLQRSIVAVLLSSVLALACCAQVAPSMDAPSDTTGPATVEQGRVSQPQPTAHITGWSFKDEMSDQPLQHGEQLTLGAGHPDLILFFGATDAEAQAPEFRYRLDDYDPDWTTTRDTNAHYRRLPPGRYRFEVQARLPGQPWQTPLAVLSVEQKPFFYQTWYALVLVGLVLLAIALQLLHQRDQLLRGQMGVVLEERNRIASDCHDTLMAGFAAISWQLENTRRLLGSTDAESTPVVQSCELARSMVAHCQAEARRIIWDLRSPEGITDLVSEGLAAALEAHRLREQIPAQLQVEGDEVPISPGAVHHLVCICQEAMTNAIRHGHADQVEIKLLFAGETLSLSVRDNGRGFQHAESARRLGHFGISVMEERARKLGGSLRIHTRPEGGTEVQVTVSYQSEYKPMTHQPQVLPWIGV